MPLAWEPRPLAGEIFVLAFKPFSLRLRYGGCIRRLPEEG